MPTECGILYNGCQPMVTAGFFFQILEAAHKIGASDMMKHALKLIVRHFPKVRLQYGVVGWSA